MDYPKFLSQTRRENTLVYKGLVFSAFFSSLKPCMILCICDKQKLVQKESCATHIDDVVDLYYVVLYLY